MNYYPALRDQTTLPVEGSLLALRYHGQDQIRRVAPRLLAATHEVTEPVVVPTAYQLAQVGLDGVAGAANGMARDIDEGVREILGARPAPRYIRSTANFAGRTLAHPGEFTLAA